MLYTVAMVTSRLQNYYILSTTTKYVINTERLHYINLDYECS